MVYFNTIFWTSGVVIINHRSNSVFQLRVVRRIDVIVDSQILDPGFVHAQKQPNVEVASEKLFDNERNTRNITANKKIDVNQYGFGKTSIGVRIFYRSRIHHVKFHVQERHVKYIHQVRKGE